MTAKTTNIFSDTENKETETVLSIREVRDSNANLIPNNGVTFDTKIIISGDAEPSRSLLIKDGFDILTIANSDSLGKWATDLFEVHKLKGYALTVWDGKSVSTPPRNLIVAQAKPSIEGVIDEEGDVEDAGNTYFNSVTITGKARPNEKVQAFNGEIPLEVGSVESKGDYKIVLENLETDATYNLTVKALYGDYESEPRSFTVRDDVGLTLDAVEDSVGAPVGEGTVTFDDTLTIKGKARPLAIIQLLDMGIVLGPPVTVEDSGDWETDIKVIPGGYALIAKKMYGDNAVTTPPRTFTVLQRVDIAIDSVEDSQGNPVAPNTVTYDNALTVRGKVTPHERVQLLNDAVAIGSPSIPATDGGIWTVELTVAKGPYKLTAKEVDTDNESTPPWNLTVLTDVDLSLDDVKDSNGQTVEPDATIRDDSVTVSGNARPRETIYLFNNGSPTSAEGPVDDDGHWEIRLPVSIGTYSLTAKEMTSGEVSSDPRTFTVRAILSATLDSVVTTGGTVIEKEGFTYETTLIVKGSAEPGETIELFDGEVSLGDATAQDNQLYEKTISGLSVKSYSLEARPKYPEGGISDRYSFEVRASPAPWETRVHQLSGLIPDNGTTSDTYVVVRGFTQASKSVKIKVNGVINPKLEPANNDGKWAGLIVGLQNGPYVVSAVSSDDDSAESNKWTFTHVAAADSTESN